MLEVPTSTANAGPYRPAPGDTDIYTAPRAPMRRRELCAIAAGVVLVDLALFDGDGLAAGGYGGAIFFLGVALVMLVGARVWRRSPRLGAIAAGLGLVVARTAIDPTPLTVLSGLGLLAGFAIALRTPRATVARVARSMGRAVLAYPRRAIASVAGVRTVGATLRLGRISVLPILVPIALSAIFIGVFALANPVVGDAVARVFEIIGAGIRLPTFSRVFAWIVALALGVALVRPSISLASRPDAADSTGEATAVRLAIARNTMISVNALFLLYNAIEITHVFGGRPPDGMTTQTYAHYGAFWLTVALMLLTMVVGALFHGAVAHDPKARLARGLAFVWIGQGLVVAIGTACRIAMHIQFSGLSNLRIVGILGTTIVVIGMLVVAMKLRRRRSWAWLVGRQLDVLAIAVVVYSVFPTHFVSARVNVWRIESGALAPLLHMRAQAAQNESCTALLPLLDHDDAVVREGVAALLDEKRAELRATLAETGSFRERDVLSHRVLSELDAAGPRIREASSPDPNEARIALDALAYSAH